MKRSRALTARGVSSALSVSAMVLALALVGAKVVPNIARAQRGGRAARDVAPDDRERGSVQRQGPGRQLKKKYLCPSRADRWFCGKGNEGGVMKWRPR